MRTPESGHPGRGQRRSILVLGLVLGLSLIRTPYPRDQYLQHIPTVIGLACLWWSTYRRVFSNHAMACISAFTLLHIVAARYVYTLVPYDALWTAWFGHPLSEVFGWRRNHFDRFAHFLFGILATLPLAECIGRSTGAQPRVLTLLAWTAVWGISSLYECAEGLVTLIADPTMANNYNGQQGDLWDAQKDMGLAGLGSTLVWIPVVRRLRPHPSSLTPC